MNKNENFSLRHIAKGKIALLGIGNTLRGDDGIGPSLIEKIKNRVIAMCINGENAPENYAGKIIKTNPDTLIIIDAVHFNGKPGEYQIMRAKDLVDCGLTTHDISLVKIIEYIKMYTKTEIYILGVQPCQTGFGTSLSTYVQKTMDVLQKELINVLNVG